MALVSRIILATTNKGKIAELSGILADFNVQVSGLADWPQIGAIEENGATFQENALIKARTAAQATGLICVADDSGLEVEALNGAPGVYSARYGDDWEYMAGENRDQRNIRKLLHEMRNVPAGQRQARFVTAMAAVRPDGREITSEGRWHGQILERPRGANGFGYDPVFFDPILGKSAAQLSREEKNAHSHRGKALRNLLAQWRELMEL